MAPAYYYVRSGQQFGPVSSGKLKELAAAGQLAPGDLIWKQGLPDWVSATKFAGLFSAEIASPEHVPTPAQPPIQDTAPALMQAAVAAPATSAPQPDADVAHASRVQSSIAEPASEPPAPQLLGSPVAENPSPHQKAGGKATRRVWTKVQGGLAEVERTLTATLQQTSRLIRYGLAFWHTRRLQRQAMETQANLGRQMFEAQVGDENLRAQLNQVAERICSVQATKGSTRLLELERKGLYLRLAEPVTKQAESVPGTATQHELARAAQAALQTHEQEHQRARSELWPMEKTNRLRVGFGYTTVALLLVTLSYFMFRSRPTPLPYVADPDVSDSPKAARQEPPAGRTAEGRLSQKKLLAQANMKAAEAEYLEAKALCEADRKRFDQEAKLATSIHAARLGASGTPLPPVKPQDFALTVRLRFAEQRYLEAKRIFEETK